MDVNTLLIIGESLTEEPLDRNATRTVSCQLKSLYDNKYDYEQVNFRIKIVEVKVYIDHALKQVSGPSLKRSIKRQVKYSRHRFRIQKHCLRRPGEHSSSS